MPVAMVPAAVSETRVPTSALRAASAVFGALGRTVICLDSSFRIWFASPTLDAILGDGAAHRAVGLEVSEVLGPVLFEPAGPLRAALESGEKREHWRMLLRCPDGSGRLISISAAPLVGSADAEPQYVILIQPADESSGAPISFSGLVARSRQMAQIFDLVQSLRTNEAPVLICGEEGTGKRLIARAIHEHSPRRHAAFVAVACGSIPSQLVGSELFGTSPEEAGRGGRVEEAKEGTLFLQDVEKLPVEAQTRLLRIIENLTVGLEPGVPSAPRIIASSTADLRRSVQDGRFREDLYYRLRFIPIDVPPLRARREDVEVLCRVFLSRANAHQGRELRLSPDAVRAILRYDWPGNSPELEAAIEYAAAVCRSNIIVPEDLPDGVQRRIPVPVEGIAVPLGAGDAAEGLRVQNALEAARWRREEAARMLGISRTTLWRKMREHGLL